MSIHIHARPGDIAETVLLPGDPLRARYIAEHFLDHAVLYNQVRGMLGFTGSFQGRRVSVQGTGMGIPSACIYAHELVREHGARRLIRIGSAGSLQPHAKIRDVVVALAASTDSGINRLRFGGADFAPTASFALLRRAMRAAEDLGILIQAGNVITSDEFYKDDPGLWTQWSRFGVLCAEMETAGLYTVAARHGVDALAILTISDSLLTGEALPAEERERGFTDMIRIALGMLHP